MVPFLSVGSSTDTLHFPLLRGTVFTLELECPASFMYHIGNESAFWAQASLWPQVYVSEYKTFPIHFFEVNWLTPETLLFLNYSNSSVELILPVSLYSNSRLPAFHPQCKILVLLRHVPCPTSIVFLQSDYTQFFRKHLSHCLTWLEVEHKYFLHKQM